MYTYRYLPSTCTPRTVFMDQLLTTLARKYLHDMIDAHSTTKENFYPRMNILFDVIKLLCCLIENRARQMPNEELFRNVKSPADLMKSITEIGIKVEQRALDLQKQRSQFVHFQQNAERDSKAWMLKKEEMKENLKRVFTMKTAEFSSKISTMNPKNQMRKACMEREIDLFVFYLTTMNNTHCSRENNMRDLRFDSKERYLKQVARYDDDIAKLYSCKTALLVKHGFIKDEYTVIQKQLDEQRSLYNKLREERDLTIRKSSLAKLARFRRNRAAKIIQQGWRLYCIRVFSRRRRGRK